MITISAYMEPAPVEIAGVDLPQPREPEENEEPGAFARILAGLLGKTGMEADSAAADGVLSVDFSGDETGIEAVTGQKKNYLFGAPAEETGKIPPKIEKDSIQKELSETELPQEHLSILLSAEHLLARMDAPVIDDAGTIPQEFPLKTENNLADKSFADFSPPSDMEETAGRAQGTAFFEGLQDALDTAFFEGLQNARAIAETVSAETSQKQERALSKNKGSEAPAAEGHRSEEVAAWRNNEPEKEGRSRLEEARGRDRRRDKITFEVRDLRTGTSNAGASKPVETHMNANAENRIRADATVREITLELRLPNQGQNLAEPVWEANAGKPGGAGSASTAGSGTALENLLARELHQNFNGDIVRHASMALRDGGEGTIRLTLKPESLGNVKIRLEMAENKIIGHIAVESEEALRAFQREIHSLEQAFRDSGFANANLNLSLTADGRGMEWREQEASSFTSQMAASRYDDSNSESFDEAQVSLINVFATRGTESVNMLV